jgi:subtilisin
MLELTGFNPSTDRHSLAGQSLYSNVSGSTSSFSSTYGYGLVNAAAAVASSIGQPTFAEVSDLGGNNWSNDMVKAPEVWTSGITGKGVTVAVIDSGVDIYHPDLNGNIWVNSDEIANDGIDNDQNGYVDDIHGWNFGVGQNNNNVLPTTTDPGQEHGTHVAGTIAATNNDIGTTGVAPNAKIMAIRMGDVQTTSSGGGFTNGGDLAKAIHYAVDNGARVINISLGWRDSATLKNAFAYAASRNVIIVSAAGNEAAFVPGTPAIYATDYGISVGAVNRYGTIAGFSNRASFDSDMRHVMAPGVSIYSTTSNGQYDFKDGTSMAAPHVSGVVALMVSANANLTHTQARDILTGTAIAYPTTSQTTLTASSASLEQSNVASNNQPALLSHRSDEVIAVQDAPTDIARQSDITGIIHVAKLHDSPDRFGSRWES